MGKGGLDQSATRATVAHGNVNSWLHEVHQAEQKERKVKARRRVVYEDVVPEDEPDKFESNLLGLAPPGMKGRTFWREQGAGPLVEMDGGEWEAKMNAKGPLLKTWHEKRKRAPTKKKKRKPGEEFGYHPHKLKDSDLKRMTIELRPDHSRALEYLAAREPRSMMAELLSAVRAEKVRLFEEIYGRKVLAAGEHCDSGHYHNDIWHYSSEEMKVGDETVIIRGNFFRKYGVGPGAARWDRHLRVLGELGHDPAVTGALPLVVAEDEKNALRDNGEEARDLRFMRALDAFVEKALFEIDPVVVERAKKEYGDFLVEGYGKGELGVKGAKTRQQAKMEELEKEVGFLRGAVAVFREFLAVLVRLPGMDKVLSSKAVAPLFQKVLMACGLGEAKEPKKPEMKGPDIAAASRRLKEQVKELEGVEIKMSRRRKHPGMTGP